MGFFRFIPFFTTRPLSPTRPRSLYIYICIYPLSLFFSPTRGYILYEKTCAHDEKSRVRPYIKRKRDGRSVISEKYCGSAVAGPYFCHRIDVRAIIREREWSPFPPLLFPMPRMVIFALAKWSVAEIHAWMDHEWGLRRSDKRDRRFLSERQIEKRLSQYTTVRI